MELYFHSSIKHIDTKQHFVKDALEDDLLEFKYMPTERMLVDFFTKGVPDNTTDVWD